MEIIELPRPDLIRQRISDCEIELKSLRRLYRMARALYDAEEARRWRVPAEKQRKVSRDHN
jgi:hypothetical protein